MSAGAGSFMACTSKCSEGRGGGGESPGLGDGESKFLRHDQCFARLRHGLIH